MLESRRVCKAEGLREPQTFELVEVLLEYAVLFDAKQRDYGPNNIGEFGEFGVLVRANDKMERLKRLLRPGAPAPSNESIEDSWMDLLGYAAIALMVRRGRWLDEPKLELPYHSNYTCYCCGYSSAKPV